MEGSALVVLLILMGTPENRWEANHYALSAYNLQYPEIGKRAEQEMQRHVNSTLLGISAMVAKQEIRFDFYSKSILLTMNQNVAIVSLKVGF